MPKSEDNPNISLPEAWTEDLRRLSFVPCRAIIGGFSDRRGCDMGVCEAAFLLLRAMLVRRLNLATENLALRQQLAVFKQSLPARHGRLDRSAESV